MTSGNSFGHTKRNAMCVTHAVLWLKAFRKRKEKAVKNSAFFVLFLKDTTFRLFLGKMTSLPPTLFIF